MFTDIDGAITLAPFLNGWYERKLLNQIFPDPPHPAEEMLGELGVHEPSKNARGGYGPSYAQLFDDPDEESR